MACTLGKSHVCCTRIEHLSVKAAGGYILKDVNLHLHCGELTAVVGANGAGKTTFIRSLLGEVAHTGRVVFEGQRCERNCPDDRTANHEMRCPCRKKVSYTTTKPRFGYVPQLFHIEEGSPVCVEDLVLSCISRWPVWLCQRKKDEQRVRDVLSCTNVQHLAKTRLSALSGGQVQRVMLALAINPVPDVLLLDEGSSGIDRAGVRSFYELVSSIRRDWDITILLVSHDLDLVARHADRVVFINGSSAIVGSVSQVYQRQDFIDTFGSVPLPKKASSWDVAR